MPSFYPKQILSAADLNAATQAAPENITAPMAAADVKLAPAAADMIPIMDSQAAGALKRMSFDALKVSPTDAGLVIYGPTGQSVAVVLTTYGSQIAAISTGQTSGVLGYDTQANLNADLAHPAQTVAYVLNDPAAGNNGVYRKSGASGTGSWVQSTGGYALQSYIDSLLEYGGYNLSGFAWAVMDSARRRALAVDSTGAVWVSEIQDVANYLRRLELTYSGASGMLWSVIDSNRRMPLGVNHRGNPIFKGEEVWPIPLKDITCFGDSLSLDSGIGYPGQLRTLTGRIVTSKSIGGRVASQIAAAAGAQAVLVNVTGNTIPASGSVNVTSFSNADLIAPTAITNTYYGWLFGIYGALYCPYGGQVTFTRAREGAATVIPPDTPFVLDKQGHEHTTCVIWAGTNDVGTATDATVVTNVTRIVDMLKAGTWRPRFVVIGPTNHSSYPTGTAGYNSMKAISDALKIAFPDNYLDVRKIMVNSYDPLQPQDVIDYGNDVPPTSLRADAIHFNSAGYAIVASAINNFLNSKGW